jgi:hypothetical protein
VGKPLEKILERTQSSELASLFRSIPETLKDANELLNQALMLSAFSSNAKGNSGMQ